MCHIMSFIRQLRLWCWVCEDDEEGCEDASEGAEDDLAEGVEGDQLENSIMENAADTIENSYKDLII